MKKQPAKIEEPFKRFCIVPVEYQTDSKFYHCNPNSVWSRFLATHFKVHLTKGELDYHKTISNASFRLAGLELKIGLLLAHEEQILGGKQLLSRSLVPSIVIDCALAIYSILEGLATLNYLCSLDKATRRDEIAKKKRPRKIEKGIRAATGKKIDSEIRSLIKLRDRCIHQDCADQQDGFDYEHAFATSSIQPHVGILFEFLKAIEHSANEMPSTNLNEFWHIRLAGDTR